MNSRKKNLPSMDHGLLTKIRWVLFIPCAFLSLVFVYLVASWLKPLIVQHETLSSVFFQVCTGTMASFISAYLFVSVGTLTAPKFKSRVAKVLGITFVLLSLGKVRDLTVLGGDTYVPWLYIFLATIAGVLGAVCASLLFRKQTESESHLLNP